jgi:hypothetical protein
VLAAPRSNLSNEETQELEELIAEYEDVFATKKSDYGWTDCNTVSTLETLGQIDNPRGGSLR